MKTTTRKILLSMINTPDRVLNPVRGKNAPRKILLSLVFCFALMNARAQYVTIPDTNFVNWLNANGFASCMVGNQMDTTCNAILSATGINCGSIYIYDLTGLNFFDNLDSIDLVGMPITTLPPIPSTVKYLWIVNTTITTLPPLPPNLQILECGKSNFPPYIGTLTSLPALPSSLKKLDCSWNVLQTLPSLPNGLTELYCMQNQLSNLPSLPQSLWKFGCDGNPPLQSALPSIILPPNLYWFTCSEINALSLPTLPSSLDFLDCRFNQLSFLPTLPPSLKYLDCSDNLLLALPILPSGLQTLNCSNNGSLNCLPHVNHLNTFYWSNTNINCLPNSLTVGTASPSITNIPLCAFSNTNNCPVYWSISGKTFTDTNSNCLADTNEVLLRNLKVKLFNNGILKQQAFSNNLGQYAFTADTGNYVYAIDTISLPLDVVCPVTFSFNTTISNVNPQNSNKDFSIECKPGFDIGVNSVLRKSGRFRPGNNATVNVVAGDISNHYNLHCATGVSGTATVIINGPASYMNATAGALIPVVNGNTLTYTIADFGTVNFQNDFSFIVQTDTTAQSGQQVCFDVSVTPLAGDNNTANNNYTLCFEVRNSYDPNEKEVSPSGSIDTSQHELTYTIYFQNTGNDTALHVYLLDTLDNAIDESSIQLLAYSHEPLVQVMGNIIKFNFPNINLPDSTTDEPNSHGYVQYRVRLNDGLVPGTVINNTAYIYFDFNAPVVTNTTFNQVDIITGLTPNLAALREVVCDIYPNPVASGGELKIVFNASTTIPAVFNIYDLSGRNVFAKIIFSSPQTQSISLPSLAEGIYNCVFNYTSGSSHKKLVVVNK